MKTLLSSLLLIAGLFLISSCEGPIGPVGPQGPQGEPGVNIVGEVFEIENVNFTAANDYFENFRFTRAISPEDKISAFILWEIDNGTDIWRPLPQTVFLSQGIFVYNFDFTRSDFSFFIEANFDRATIPSGFSRNQIFRVIVLPGKFSGSRIDMNDYQGLMNLLGKEEKDVIRLNRN